MAHPDLDELLNAALPFAQQMLSKHREFLPFGASMKRDGSINLVAGKTESEQPHSSDLIGLIGDGLRSQAAVGEIRAAVVCYDVRVRIDGSPDPVDAICASLSHISGEAVNVMLPYELRRFRGPRYGEILAEAGTINVFEGVPDETAWPT